MVGKQCDYSWWSNYWRRLSIQAESVVCKDLPAYAVAGGHPAVPFKYRNIENYKKQKSEGRYH